MVLPPARSVAIVSTGRERRTERVYRVTRRRRPTQRAVTPSTTAVKSEYFTIRSDG